MKINPTKIRKLRDELDAIINGIVDQEQKSFELIKATNTIYQKSARNLIHYKALRRNDLRPLQKRLRNLGLSRLNNAAGHVLASVLNTRYILNSLLEEDNQRLKSGLSIKNGQKLLKEHTKELLGDLSKDRRVRIMVTQPKEAADDESLVYQMVKEGMNCARINCAHDNPQVWEKIIKNVKHAADKLNRKVIITMDLAGPKIRTGTITPGPKVRKFTPLRDDSGHVLKPALIVLVPYLGRESKVNEIPIGEENLRKLREGAGLTCIDTRGKRRKLKVTKCGKDHALLDCYDTAYIGTGTILNLGLDQIKVKEMPPIEQSILLRVNDLLTVTKEDVLGTPAKFKENGELIQQAYISCQLKEVFDRIKPGERVLFDDGKIEGEVIESKHDYFTLRVKKAKPSGSKLRAEKGINFPTTHFKLNGLTAKDKVDLKFIAENADVVNFSFVNSSKDVEMLLAELEHLGVKDKLNIILKIETKEAFDNLHEILLTAMKTRYIGVMIARGDLAVETGWDKIGWVQREILHACNAAHIPVIWATQVLENLAKKGLPSRSEITDATTSLKAECVMLNKGLYIIDAIRLLSNILCDMEKYHEKNENMLPKLKRL